VWVSVEPADVLGWALLGFGIYAGVRIGRKGRIALGPLALAAAGCGGGVAGPTAPELVASPAAQAIAWPASLDPAWVHALVYMDDAGNEHPLRRWAPGAVMTHCFGGMRPDVRETAERAAAQMTALAGATRGTGACDFARSDQPDPGFVFWLMVPEVGGSPGQDMLYADTYGRAAGDGVTIVGAVLRFRNNASVGFGAVHESGHALGLGHSPRRGDCMARSSGSENFTPDERLVLATMYQGRL
jgi:hypothetical protein